MFKNIIINILTQTLYVSSFLSLLLYKLIGFKYCILISFIFVLYNINQGTYNDRLKRYKILQEHTFWCNNKEYKNFLEKTKKELTIKAEKYYHAQKDITINLIQNQHSYHELGEACAIDNSIYIDYDFFINCYNNTENEKNVIKSVIAHEIAHIYLLHTTYAASMATTKNITSEIYELLQTIADWQQTSDSVLFAILCYVIIKPLLFIHLLIEKYIKKIEIKEKHKHEYEADEFCVYAGYNEATIQFLSAFLQCDKEHTATSSHPKNADRIQNIKKLTSVK